MTSHRRVLGVRPDADAAALKAAFHAQSQKHHPDHGGSAETFQQVKAAYDSLAKEEYNQRWGTSNSSYGAIASSTQQRMLKNRAD
eukprot:CAMPEP_0172765330 /NCGR_PEP_ID=MMETSP1074-20121228/179067_1 /TAXON_ID=2916 /ORGANISM="Ceratium fusus, Strain PA161109" /LENGTH=84 /DNA_ID=CAMNT_0013600257 /DNA_START=1 /DNA_END=255 /DNA_ORIENTATION=+